jgi:cbb3-type cytochrome oxidase subunit 3
MNVTWPVLSFFLGLLLGHWLSLGRDRRKEFNDEAEKLFLPLESERKNPSAYAKHPNAEDFAIFRRHLRWWQVRKFDQAVDAYFESKKNCAARDSTGGVYYRDAERIIPTVERLLRFTRRR